MKKYLDDLRDALKKTSLTTIEIEDIVNDYRDMIENALEEGLDPKNIEDKFGEVSTLAAALGSPKEKPEKSAEDTASPQKETEIGRYDVDDEKAFEMHVRCTHETIRYTKTDDEQLVVTIKNGNAADYEVSFKENILRLENLNTSGVLGSFMGAFKSGKRNTEFLIKVPKSINVERIKHHSVSGDMMMKDLDVVLMNVKTTSGDITIRGDKLGNVRINGVSGDLDMKATTASNVKFSMISGNASVESINLEETLEMSTVSGNIAIREVSCDTCYVSSVSGDVKGNEFYPKKVALKSVSGDIVIKNTEDKPIEVLRKKSVSGDIKIKNA